MKPNTKNYLIFWLAVVITSIFMAVACQKPDQPEYCFECHSPQMTKLVQCGISETDMQTVIDKRIELFGDTMKCEKKFNLNIEP
jgi:hypothetical protein